MFSRGRGTERAWRGVHLRAAGEPPRPASMSRPLLAASLLACLSVAGCDSLDSLLGDFRGTIDVDAAREAVEGEAVYTIVETADGPRFVLGLFVDGLTENTADDYDYVVFYLDGARPDVGAYAVVPGSDGRRDATATLARIADADDPPDTRGVLLRATDGTLTITRVDTYGFLAGSFQIDATGVRVEAPEAPVTGAASGRFEARYEPPAVFRRLGIAL